MRSQRHERHTLSASVGARISFSSFSPDGGDDCHSWTTKLVSVMQNQNEHFKFIVSRNQAQSQSPMG